MGANFRTMSLPGDMPRAKVKEEFRKAMDDDLHENGHSYSGGFGTTTGVEFSERNFQDRDQAETWIEEKAQKWEAALAVQCPDKDGKVIWLIGAWCAS